MFDLKTIRDLMNEIAERVIPDLDCKVCVFQYDPWMRLAKPLYAIWCTDRAGYVLPCEPCSKRRPYEWILDLTAVQVKAFVDAQTNAWPIDALKALLPTCPRGGFEFL